MHSLVSSHRRHAIKLWRLLMPLALDACSTETGSLGNPKAPEDPEPENPCEGDVVVESAPARRLSPAKSIAWGVMMALIVGLVGCSLVTVVPVVDDGEGGGAGAGQDDRGAICGNSIVEAENNEVCDSGGVNTADCDSDCTAPACADGVFNAAAEDCDDGNTSDDGNGCDGLCRKNSLCADGVVQDWFEACDDGNEVGGDACSADCTQAVASILPTSDRGGGDFDGDGTFDGLNNENSTGEAIVFGDPEERRIAWEFNSSLLRPGYIIESASLSLFSNNISGGPQKLQLHSYLANGGVELADMTVDSLVEEVTVVATTPPLVFDVAAFIQTAADEAYPFAGFMLRIAAKPSGFFNLGITMSNNPNDAIRPRLDVVFCADPDGDKSCQ